MVCSTVAAAAGNNREAGNNPAWCQKILRTRVWARTAGRRVGKSKIAPGEWNSVQDIDSDTVRDTGKVVGHREIPKVLDRILAEDTVCLPHRHFGGTQTEDTDGSSAEVSGSETVDGRCRSNQRRPVGWVGPRSSTSAFRRRSPTIIANIWHPRSKLFLSSGSGNCQKYLNYKDIKTIFSYQFYTILINIISNRHIKSNRHRTIIMYYIINYLYYYAHVKNSSTPLVEFLSSLLSWTAVTSAPRPQHNHSTNHMKL